MELTHAEVIEWLRERFDNCNRIALQKAGEDRVGWLVDAEYFRAAINFIAKS